MKVLIAGAGMGGLTAALCCARRGFEVVVLERSAHLGEAGAGIQIPPNALKIFRELGIEARIARDAVRPTSIRTRMGRSGRIIFDIPLGYAAETRWGAPYLHIHRADYVKALRESLPHHVDLRLGVGVEATHQEADRVRVDLSDGTQVDGDVLIGADGIWSTVRTALFGEDTPRFTGNIAWRATVPIEALGSDAPDAVASAWMGPGRHAVTYRVRRGKLANFVGVVERDAPGSDSWRERGSRGEALADFDGWHPTIQAILHAVDESALYRWALYDRAPLARWSAGRVTLLGDAAHPMLPFLAQGAAMAVEDGWVLAEELARSPSQPDDALSRYEARRQSRTARVQAASRANMTTFHKRTRMQQIATYGPMWLGGKLLPSVVRGRLDWLYGFDAVG